MIESLKLISCLAAVCRYRGCRCPDTFDNGKLPTGWLLFLESSVPDSRQHRSGNSLTHQDGSAQATMILKVRHQLSLQLESP